MKTLSHVRSLATTTLIAAAAACSGDTTTPQVVEPTALLSVQPSAGSVGVSVGTQVVVTFDHGIADGMEEYVDLHQDSLAGPVVDGVWALSTDHTMLTFTPASPLEPATTYVIHIGGGMMDEDGDHVDLEMHGMDMGGAWATESMMTGGMGGMMGGQSGMGSHMGTGWESPTGGTFGMVFTFTTAG